MPEGLVQQAIEWGLYVGANPCHTVRPYPYRPRARFVLPGEEMQRLQAALAQESPRAQAYFYTLLLTGARRCEVQRMKWCELDLSRGLWTKWTSKSHRAQSLIIPAAALALITALPRQHEYVFGVSTGEPPWTFSHIRWVWCRIRRRAHLEDVTTHDLRRTCASWLAMHGENAVVIQSVLNHSSLQYTGIYARLNLAPVRDALAHNAERMLQNLPSHQEEPR